MPVPPPSPERSPQTAAARSQLRTALQSNSTRVDLASLAQRRKSARLVTREVLERVMIETIENVLLEGGADPVLGRDALLAKTREEFDRLLASHRQAESEREQAEVARANLEKQVRALKQELTEQNARLQHEIERSAPQVRFSEEALAAMEARVRAVLTDVVGEARREATGGDGAQLERRLQGVVDEILQEERDKARARALEVRDLEVERLQRRIAKLNRALGDTESTLAQVAASKQIDPGVASSYDRVQGPAADSVNAERKQELIKVVFVNNLLLRDRPVQASDLEGIPPGLLISTDRPAYEASGVDSAPLDPTTDETAF